MNDTIKALVASQKPDSPLVPLTLAQLKHANKYVTDGRTADLTESVIGYLAAQTKLVDYQEYLATTRMLFYRLPTGAMLDGCTCWPRWIEHYFQAHEKNQKDYINRLARTKREQSSLPKTETKPDSDTKHTDGLTAKQISREIVAADYSVEELEYLAKTISDELQRKRNTNDTEPAALVVATQPPPRHAKKVATKKVAKKIAAAKKVKPSPSDSVAQRLDDDTDGIPFGYEDGEEDIDAVIDGLNANANPNLDELDEVCE